MFITAIDLEILKKEKTRKLQELYLERFNERLIFNYQDFRRYNGKCAAEMYIDAMETAIKSGVPYVPQYKPEEE